MSVFLLIVAILLAGAAASLRLQLAGRPPDDPFPNDDDTPFDKGFFSTDGSARGLLSAFAMLVFGDFDLEADVDRPSGTVSSEKTIAPRGGAAI